MEAFQSQDGHQFIRGVAQYIRQHEKALANSLQLTVQRRKPAHPDSNLVVPASPGAASQSSTSTLAAALSFAGLNFKSHSVKSVQLTLTPHHLFYLLSRIEELEVDVGPMNVRIESIHNDASPANYISFLQSHNTHRSRGDADSIHSVSSVRSVMSGMSALWSNVGMSNSSAKSEKARLSLENDIKYVYGAFTKLPALRLTPDHRSPLIRGHEQFPFDTAVPLFAFKNVQQLEVIDLDFRSFHGWDRLADQLSLLTIRRGNIDDPIDLLEHVVLDDMEKKRRRSNRSQGAPSTPSWSMPSTPKGEYARSHSDPDSPRNSSPGTSPPPHNRRSEQRDITPVKPKPTRSHTFVEGTSPKRFAPVRPATSYRHSRSYSKVKRSGSGSSNSSDNIATPAKTETGPNMSWLPSKWQRLVYLSLADNGLTALPTRSIQAIAPSLRSFNLSSNLFIEIPESLATMSRLVSLDLSNCMIDSLQSLQSTPLLTLTTLKLKSNRLRSLVGIESLVKLENLNVQDNKISDPDEAARLTHLPRFRKLWIKHNPLTRSFTDYRIRILNHFRRVPGFAEDIVIDDHSPSYSERKHLIDRVADIRLPMVQPRLEPSPVTVVQEEPVPSRTRDSTSRSLGPTLQREVSAASSRRKKGTKRRIVDLADQDVGHGQHALTETPEGPEYAPSTKPSVTKPLLAMENETKSPSPQASAEAPIDDMARTLTTGFRAPEEYQQNIDDLRIKLGNTWLTALGDQHTQWQSETDLPAMNSTRSPPPKLHHYHSTPPILGVGGNIS